MKKKLIILQLFIAIILISTNVYAAVNATLEFKASETQLKQGDTVDVTLSIKNITGSTTGITDIVGDIKYDKNIFEEISINNIAKNSEGKVEIGNNVLTIGEPTSSADVLFNKQNGRILIEELNNPLTSNTDIITIQFTVKNSATLGTVNKAVSFEIIDLLSGFESVDADTETSINLEVVSSQDDTNTNTDTNNTNTNTNNTNTNTNNTNTNTNNTNTNTNNTNTNNTNTNTNNTNTNNTNTNTNNTNTNSTNTNTNSNIDNTVSKKELPATGLKAIMIPIIALTVIAYVSYNRYLKYKDV